MSTLLESTLTPQQRTDCAAGDRADAKADRVLAHYEGLASEAEGRSQKLAAAGFTARDRRLTCDECGAKFTVQFAPLHECAGALLAALEGLIARHNDGSDEEWWAEWDTAAEAVSEAKGTTK